MSHHSPVERRKSQTVVQMSTEELGSDTVRDPRKTLVIIGDCITTLFVFSSGKVIVRIVFWEEKSLRSRINFDSYVLST